MLQEPTDRRYTLITLLNLTAHAMVEELIARMIPKGFSDVRPVDHQVFENLDRGGTRVSELAARAQMTHQSMSELVASLEARGYVERLPDPADQRAKLVRLTHEGRVLVREALAEIERIETEWFGQAKQSPGKDVHSVLTQALQGAQRLPEGINSG